MLPETMGQNARPDSTPDSLRGFDPAGDSIGLDSKGYNQLAKTKAVQIGLNNDWLKAQGLVSVKEQWITTIIPMANEPPPMRTRMYAGVGRAGEKPALTQLDLYFASPILIVLHPSAYLRNQVMPLLLATTQE